MPALPRIPQNAQSWLQPVKRQGALSGVTQSAESAGKSGYNSVKAASSTLSTGQIVGAVIAIVIGFALVCLMLWYLCIRRTRRHRGTNTVNPPQYKKHSMTQFGRGSNTNVQRPSRTAYESYDFSKVGRGSKIGGHHHSNSSREHLTSSAA
ncbi:unnamed protein product [Sympodiomycopsis kandeliae]